MKTVLNRLLISVLIMNASSCSLFAPGEDTGPEIDKLPLATSSGKDTFGCLVNGKAFVPYTKVDLAAVFQGGILQISGRLDEPAKPDVPQWIALTLIEDASHKVELGTYQLTNPPFQDAKCSIHDCRYYEEHVTNGWITLTRLDRANFIVSGTFEFTAEGNDCEKIVITNGRFDIKYVPFK